MTRGPGLADFANGGAVRLRPDTLEFCRDAGDDLPELSIGLPELRIVRTAAIEGDHSLPWNRFLNNLGRFNFGKGRARSLGSVAATYVTANEMGKMLEVKYPKVLQDRRRTIQLMHRVAKNYGIFVRNGGKDEDEKANLIVEHEIELATRPLDFDLEGEDWDQQFGETSSGSETLTAAPCHKWQIGDFSVRAFSKYSRNGLGLDLSQNRVLGEELEETIAFLKDEKFNIDLIDPERTPHLVVFDTFAELGRIELKSSMPPAQIILEEPHALSSY